MAIGQVGRREGPVATGVGGRRLGDLRAIDGEVHRGEGVVVPDSVALEVTPSVAERPVSSISAAAT